MPAAQMTADEASRFLAEHAGNGWTPGEIWNGIEGLDGEALEATYRLAAKKLHPEAGGSTADFQRLQEAKRVLEGATA